MKSLILAVALALTPVPALAQTTPAPQTQIVRPMTNDEILSVAEVCAALHNKKVTADQVVTGLNLNTPGKRASFVNLCKMLELGVEVGIQVSQQSETTTS